MATNGLPQVGVIVVAEVEHCIGEYKATVELIAVDESDVSWRFADDQSELSYDWDVMSWEYKE